MRDSTQREGLFTLGQLAERLGVPVHRLKYAIDQHRILPAMRVGILRVWSENEIPRMRRALARVAENRRRPKTGEVEGVER